jgi:NADPH:quinone reductase-like Zn-dependent oxidoreductase
MLAAVCTGYGPPDVLELQDVPKPVPRDDEILVKISASTVSSSDWFVRSGLPAAPLATRVAMKVLVGLRRPRHPILGLIVAGEVEAKGKDVTRFAVGDRVFAFTKFHFGGYAEYTCLKERSTVALAPPSLSFEESASIVYGGLLALHYLRKGNLQPGQRALIYGASGAVGTSAVQLATRLFGAHVTAVCSTANHELVKSLGAEAAIDYTTEQAPPAGVLYDLVLDAVGKRKTSPLKVACTRALAPGGHAVSVDDGTPELSATDLDLLRDLVASGILEPVIDRIFPLERIAEAHGYVEQEHKKGNVVIHIGHPAN